jgi:2-polyprenyl-6-methoxyphenol hydroxylase-like FAD-dependent oxidoreductase
MPPWRNEGFVIMDAATFANRYDAVIVGARPAGAGTALLLARAGLRVLVIDRGRHGADTLSTHALMRGGVAQLRRWGALTRVLASGTPAVRRATFVYSGDALAVPIKARDGVDALYAPRRTVLDPAIVDTAIEAGVQVSYGTRLVDLVRDRGSRVRGIVAESDDGRSHHLPAGLVIGADGMRSSVARLVGAATTRSGRWAAANVFGYWAGLPVDGYRWYFHPGLAAGAIPTNDGLTCVFASAPAPRFAELFKGDVAAGYHRVLAEAAPDIAGHMAGATLAGSLHGFPGPVGYFRRSAGPGWALVGDAAYFKDPITAHGITDALIDAELLARAASTGTDAALSGYEEERNRRGETLFEVTDRLASFEWTLDDARALHKTLSEEMSREVRVLNGRAMEETTV